MRRGPFCLPLVLLGLSLAAGCSDQRAPLGAPHALGKPLLDSRSATFHGTAAFLDSLQCSSCHNVKEKCSRCHFGQGGAKVPAGVDWTHGTFPHGLEGLRAAGEVCDRCHSLTKQIRNEPAGCHTCHEAPGTPHSLDKDWFVKQAGASTHWEASSAGSLKCDSCHSPLAAFCSAQCHFDNAGAKTPPDVAYTHGAFPHESDALKANGQVCDRCHDLMQELTDQPATCHRCHEAPAVAHSFGKDWFVKQPGAQTHWEASSAGTLPCATCHSPLADFCAAQCHFDSSGGKTPAGVASWNHGNATARHAARDLLSQAEQGICTKCHAMMQGFTGAPGFTDCAGACHGFAYHGPGYAAGHGSGAKADLLICRNCHDTPDSGTGVPNYDGYVTGRGCVDCHPEARAHPTTWIPAPPAFDRHNKAGRIPVACAVCHTVDVASSATSPLASAPRCGQCHPDGFTPHAPGYGAPEKHGADAKAGQMMITCQVCHGNPPTGGSNPRFNVAKSTLANGCEDCHNDLTAHPSSGTRDQIHWHGVVAHADANRDAMVAACGLCHGPSLGGGVGPACSTCHTLGSPVTALSCTSCHGSPPNGASQPNRDGAHTDHNGLPKVAGACGVCHAGAGNRTVNHLNGTADFSVISAYNAKSGAASVSGNTCLNVSCHGGQTTPDWLTGEINVLTDCTRCHAAGSGQYNGYTSGQHAPHVATLGLPCTDCHNNASLEGSHFTNLDTPTMEGPAASTVGGGNTKVASYSAPTCTPLAGSGCHTARSWGSSHAADGSFRAASAHGPPAKANLIACQLCHGTPATGGAGSNPRFNVVVGSLTSGCESCHNDRTAHPTSGARERVHWYGSFSHADAGNVANACGLCHGAGLAGGSGAACSTCHTLASPLTALNCTSCHGSPPSGSAAPNRQGAHAAHATLPNVTTTCAPCHNGAGNRTPAHYNNTVDFGFLSAYNAKPGAAAFAGGTCTNVSCHGGQTTPSWLSGSIDVAGACTQCHAAGTTQYNGYTSGRHDTHVATRGYACTACHNPATLGPGTSHFARLDTAAMEGPASATIGGGATSVGSYVAATQTCTPTSASSCHAARSWTGSGAPHDVGSAWLAATGHGPSAKADLTYCRQCHSDLPNGAPGSNPRFNVAVGGLANGCENCHNNLTAHPSSGAREAVHWYGLISHADAGNMANACGLCHGGIGLTGGNGPACGTCHTLGSPLTALNCTSCHGSPPNGGAAPNRQGAHPAHAALPNVTTTCTPCHNGAGNRTAAHRNGTVNFGFLGAYNAKSGVASAAGATCTNVSCHGGQTTPNWLTGTIDVATGCTQCHAAGTAQYNGYTSGRHDTHVTTRGTACTACHNAATLGSGSSHFSRLDTTVMEGPASSTIGGGATSVSSYVAATQTCTPTSASSCHGARSWTGTGAAPHAVGAAWLAATGHGPDAKADLTDCQDCHSNLPNGAPGSNPRFNLAVGSLANGCENCHNNLTAHPSSGAREAVHWYGLISHADAGNVANACGLCHGAGLGGGSGPACGTCHTLGSPLTLSNCTSCHGSPPNGAAQPNRQGAHDDHSQLPNVAGTCTPCHTGAGNRTARHYNGAVDFGIPSVYNARSGTASASVTTCTNVSCHGGQTTPDWLTGAINVATDCTRCHASGTGQYNGYFSGQHQKHLTDTEGDLPLGCTGCHNPATLGVGSSHFARLDTPAMEGPASATIGGGSTRVASYVPATQTCTPSSSQGCHGAERWTGGD